MPVRRLVALAPLALLPLAIPAAADAATSWDTVATAVDGKLQACRTLSGSGDAWKIRWRLDARNSDVRLHAKVVVTHNGSKTDRRWASGWVPAGSVSDPGAVYVPRSGSGWEMSYSASSDNAGGGGTIKPMAIAHC